MSNQDIENQYRYIGNQLRRLERSYPFKMGFTPELEKRYQKHYGLRYLSHVRIALVLGFLSVFATALIEVFALDSPSSFYSWLIRMTALAVLALGWRWTSKPQKFVQRVIFAGSLILSLVALEFARINEPPYKHLYYSALVYVQIFAFALSRLQFRWAIPCAVVIFLTGNTYIWWFDPMILADQLIILFMLAAGGMVSVIVCYLLERAVRTSYLQSELLGLEKKLLQENNVQLRDELLHDGLTRVTSRRAFDTALAQEWDRALRNRYSLALILFDVDYFKQYNDHYGHQAGDACLISVASAPHAMIRRAGDSVARYGGEEFVVTLIGTTLDDAKLFAEELRERVMELSIAHAHSEVADVVTISCGVAALIPDSQSTQDDLVRLADNALYEAKRAGRNKVVCSSVVSIAKDKTNKKTA